MSAKNELTGKEAKITSATQTHADAVATVTANTDSLVVTTYVTGLILSASAAITTSGGVTATLAGCVGGTLSLQLSANATAPIVVMFGTHPLRATPGTDVVLTLPDLGAGVVGTATLLTYQGAI